MRKRRERGGGGRRGALVALGLLLVAATGACGSDDEAGGAGVASLDGSPAAAQDASTDASGEKDPEEALLAFAECMRENGVDMPDPQPGGGSLVVGPGQDEADESTLRKAEEACEEFRQDVEGTFGPGGEPPAEFQDALLAMARCMREHGVDVPDPTFGAGGQARSELHVDIDDPKFKEAQQACAEEVELPRPGATPEGSK